MRKIPSKRPAAPGAQQGVMLLEALVAILIFTCGIVAVLGMQSASILQVSQAKYRTDAAYLANQIIGKMWVDRANLAHYTTSGDSVRASWDTTVAKTLPNGTGTIAWPDTTNGQITVTIQWHAPDETLNHKYVAAANIRSTLDP